MRKIFWPLMLMIFLLTSCGGDFKEKEKFVVGIDDDFAPMGFYDERGELVGFDIDLAKEVAERMNAEFTFKPIEWNKKREEITSGNVDMIWNGLDITEERKEYMIFSRPYMDDRQIFLVKDGNGQGIFSESGLEGKRVGVQTGATAEDYLRHDTGLRDSFKEYKIFDKIHDAINALKNDEIDVFICDELVARYETKEFPDQLEIIEVKTDSITEMGVGFAKDNVKLRDKVQQAFDEIIRDGTAKKISEKWFHADLIKP